jgi:L-iditol 2-dehydrogenase
MSASVLFGDGTIAIQERPVPVPAADEVLVEVSTVGVCGSDMHHYNHRRNGDASNTTPVILGHEVGGRIADVGSTVDPARIGERVAVEPQRPCRVCEYCRSGAYNLCPNMKFFADPPVDGAFVQYLTIPADFAFAIPESVSDRAAALIEPLSVGIAAIQKAGVGVGASVLVAGGGPVGLLTAMVARAFGASTVMVTDRNLPRRERIAAHGFTAVDPSDSIEDLDVTAFVDATGSVSAIQAGVGSVRRGGSVVIVGAVETVPLPMARIASREITVTGTFRYANTWPIGIHLVASRAVELDDLVTHEFGLEQVEQSLQRDPGSLKRVVLPGVSHVEEPSLLARAQRAV